MTIKRIFLALLIVLSFVFCLFFAKSYAATVNALSASYSDVLAAVSSASSGDTVIVPAGTATWSSPLLITKGIILQGAGIGKTVITNGVTPGSNDQCLGYGPASPELNETFRLTGFTFDGNGTNHAIGVGNKTRTVITNVRIDHNRFQNCYGEGVFIRGEVYGLVDHNQFEDNRLDIFVNGYDWYSWIDLSPPVLGSANYVVVEDNTLNYTDAFRTAHPSWGVPFSTGQGGNITFRYNTITNYLAFDIFDAHGNQEPVTQQFSPGGSRGTIAIEVYENDVSSVKVTGHRLLYHRGGTAIVFNNRVTGTASDATIVMIEEDGPARLNFLSEWPGYDPIQNTYYFNNTLNGETITPSVNAQSTVFIQQGRDYWLTNPVGQTIGGSVYTPLQYPHPMSRPSPPVNLRIVK